MGRTSKAIAHIIAVLLGVPASLVVGAAVFADGSAILSAERIVPVVLTYLAVGAIFSFICRLIWQATPWWNWGVSISIPAVFTVGLLGTDIGPGYQTGYVAAALVSASLGAFVGRFPADTLRRQ